MTEQNGSSYHSLTNGWFIIKIQGEAKVSPFFVFIYELFNMDKKLFKEIRNKLKFFEREKKHKYKENPLYRNKGNGQWGYYVNEDFGDVVNYMNEHNLTSLVDLGAGEGHIVELLNDMGYNAKGYEIEEELIDKYHENFSRNNVFQKDVMDITKEDIEDFQVIYMYQPFSDRTLLKKFLHRLINEMNVDQTIVYKDEKRIPNWFVSHLVKKEPIIYGYHEIFRIL